MSKLSLPLKLEVYYKVYLLSFCRFLILLSFCQSCAYGQDEIYISNLEGIHIFESDSIGFFSNTVIDGVVGSEAGSNLIFLGQKWENKDSSEFPGDGRFTFQQPSILGLDTVQSLGGVDWNNRFPNMVLRNANDVKLFGVSGSRDTFLFDTGYIIHDQNDFVVGDGYPGVIQGYGKTKYFVTNYDHTIDTGFLVRHSIGTAEVDFPVGNSKNDYNPARFKNTGDLDTFSVRVFKNVYAEGNSGIIDALSTVQRTWNILENTSGNSDIELTLQHNRSTEGAMYDRSNQFVSRYFGQTNNAYRDTSLGSKWDFASVVNSYGNTAGSITTGASDGYQSTRSRFISTNFTKGAPTRYFTKMGFSAPVPVKLLYFSAKWSGSENAEILWGTASELNNKEFVVYRRYKNTEWEYLSTEFSKAPGGNSAGLLNYSIVDNSISSVESVVYYKLVQKDFDGMYEEFGPAVLEREQNQVSLDVLAFPNPAKNEIYLNFEGEIEGDFELEFLDILGKSVFRLEMTKGSYLETTRIDLTQIRKGSYWIRVTAKENRKLVVTKLIIII